MTECKWWKGKLKTWWRGDLREHCLFLCLFISLLCQDDNLHHVLKFYDTVSLKEMNDSPSAGFFRAWQSTVTSLQRCLNILQPLDHRVLSPVWGPSWVTQQHESCNTSWVSAFSKFGDLSLELYSWTQECSYFMLPGEWPMSLTASHQSSCQ